MSPPKLSPANLQAAIPTLLQRQVTLHREGTAKKVSLTPLSMLIFESARRYLADPVKFGTTAKTLDLALKPAFAVMFPTDKHKSRFKAGFAVYEKLADQIPTTVAGQKLRTYCGETPSQKPLQEVWELLRDTKGLHLKDLPLPKGEGLAIGKEVKRRVIVSLDGIECKNPEELTGDEIYFITTGALFGTQGDLERTAGMSPVTSNVVSGSNLAIPGGYLKYPVHYDLIEKYMVPKPLPAYSVCYSFTLWEHDYSEAERIQALMDACEALTDALNSLCDGNYAMFAYYLAKYYVELAISADGDDLLGTRDFQFDNICPMPLPTTKDTTVDFHGTHLANKYKYVVSSHFALESLP